MMGTQKIQSLLKIIVLILSPSDKDLGDGNFETPSWHLQRYLCVYTSVHLCEVHTLSMRVKDDENHCTIRWTLNGQYSWSLMECCSRLMTLLVT